MKIEIWKSEYELRQLLYIATRWQIGNTSTNQVLENLFENSRENFEEFRTQLNQKLTDANNWKAIEVDLRNKFIKSINNYIEWHIEHKKEIKEHHIYDLILNVVESTKAEILQYFPEKPEIKPIEWIRIYADEIRKEAKKIGNFTDAVKNICIKHEREYTKALRVQAHKELK